MVRSLNIFWLSNVFLCQCHYNRSAVLILDMYLPLHLLSQQATNSFLFPFPFSGRWLLWRQPAFIHITGSDQQFNRNYIDPSWRRVHNKLSNGIQAKLCHKLHHKLYFTALDLIINTSDRTLVPFSAKCKYVTVLNFMSLKQVFSARLRFMCLTDRSSTHYDTVLKVCCAVWEVFSSPQL